MFKSKEKQIWYKLGKEKEKYPVLVYYILECLLIIWELIKGFLRFCNGLLVTICIFISIFLIIVYNMVKPTADSCFNYVKKTAYTTNIDTFRLRNESIRDNYIEYNDIPEHIIEGLVLTEDITFWKNNGLDIKGTVFNLVDSLKDEKTETVYTITQQLTREVFLDNKIGIENKAKEMLLALKLDNKFSKENIIEFYCNCMNYGNDIYGLENASKMYFGKEVSDLNLKEQVYLCAIVGNPNNYNPWKNYKKVEIRSEEILCILLENNYITQEEYDNSVKENIVILRK